MEVVDVKMVGAKKRAFVSIAVALLICSLTAALATAQGDPYDVYGFVYDTDGVTKVVGASVSIRLNSVEVWSGTTNVNGAYTYTFSPGSWNVGDVITVAVTRGMDYGSGSHTITQGETHAVMDVTLQDSTPPSQVQGLTATAGNRVVTLSWIANTESDLKEYWVYRNGSKIATVTAPTTGYADTGLTNGQQYSYQVSAVDVNNNEGQKSAPATATPHTDTVPAQVTGLSASEGNKQVSLSWTANSVNDEVTHYNVYRDGSNTPIAQPTSNSYADTGLTNGQTYTYQISAVNAVGEGQKSSPVSATPHEIIPPNNPPVADVGGPYSVDEGETVVLDGTGSSDPDGTIVSYSWTIMSDPTGEASLTGADTATPTFHAPSVESDTSVTVRLTVEDDDGATDSDTATVTIHAVPVPPVDFSISVSPTSGSLVRGGSTGATVSVSSIGGFSDVVSLSASGLPSGATASFSPPSGTPSFTSTLTISTSETTPVGTYSVTITGTGGGKTHSTTYTLTVTATVPIPPEIIQVESPPVHIPEITLGTPQDISIENTDIIGMMINVSESVENVQIIVQQLTERPATIEIAAPGTTYLCFNIVVENMSDAQIENVIINFKVEKSWITQNTIDMSTITLNRYDPVAGEWTSLPATYLSEDDTYVYFSVVSPGLSVFAVSGTTVAPPAEFELSNLVIDPSEVGLGEAVTISVVVTNVGDLGGTCTVTLKIDNVVEATEDVTLAGGAAETVTFTVSRDVEGTYYVEVDGLTGTFVVTAPPPIGPLEIIVVALIVVALLAMILIWLRRRGTINFYRSSTFYSLAGVLN